MISIDAMGRRTDIAAKIREQEPNYVLPVKENQPALYRETNEYFEGVEEGWGLNPPADVKRSGLEKKIPCGGKRETHGLQPLLHQ